MPWGNRRYIVKDLTGMRYGRLTVLNRIDKKVLPEKSDVVWLCHCDCGKEKHISSGNLISGRTKSCGCFNKEVASQRATIHGHACNGGKTLTWRRWEAMRERCLEPNHTSYLAYGGRGITICAGWLKEFSTFLSDMGECPHASGQSSVVSEGREFHALLFNDQTGRYAGR